MKDFYFTAGWKMNLDVIESINYAKKVTEYVNLIPDFNKKFKLIIFPDPLSLYSVSEIFKNSPIRIGSPDLFWEDKGAYTGGISPFFLKKIGCNYALIGHPERLNNLKEDSQMVNKKIKAAFRNNIKPFLIISEKNNPSREKIISQVRNDILSYTEGLKSEEIVEIAIIYEPSWAINTTESASTDYITEMVSEVRMFLNKDLGSELGSNINISYGGGVNIKNFKYIIEVKMLDGIGIGKASLDFNFFTNCIDTVNNKLNNK